MNRETITCTSYSPTKPDYHSFIDNRPIRTRLTANNTINMNLPNLLALSMAILSAEAWHFTATTKKVKAQSFRIQGCNYILSEVDVTDCYDTEAPWTKKDCLTVSVDGCLGHGTRLAFPQ